MHAYPPEPQRDTDKERGQDFPSSTDPRAPYRFDRLVLYDNDHVCTVLYSTNTNRAIPAKRNPPPGYNDFAIIIARLPSRVEGALTRVHQRTQRLYTLYQSTTCGQQPSNGKIGGPSAISDEGKRCETSRCPP